MGIRYARLVENTSLCGSPLAALAAIRPSVPAPPLLLVTTTGTGISLYFCTTDCTTRANWSVPPPGPAVTMNSTGRVGFHSAAKAGSTQAARPSAAASFLGLMLSPGSGKEGGVLLAAQREQFGSGIDGDVVEADRLARGHVAHQRAVGGEVEGQRHAGAERRGGD